MKCDHCGHEWVSVSPVEARELECPQCHKMSRIDDIPACPRCGGIRLRREVRRIGVKGNPRGYASGGWYFCLGCGNCFDGVTDHDDGILPWWVEKRKAGRVWDIDIEVDKAERRQNDEG